MSGLVVPFGNLQTIALETESVVPRALTCAPVCSHLLDLQRALLPGDGGVRNCTGLSPRPHLERIAKARKIRDA